MGRTEVVQATVAHSLYSLQGERYDDSSMELIAHGTIRFIFCSDCSEATFSAVLQSTNGDY